MLEGIGAALVLPALAALIAGNYVGKDRVVAYAVVGGVAGAGIAVGPILGGWVTTEFTWRYVFVGEVVLVGVILCMIKLLRRRTVCRAASPRSTGSARCCRLWASASSCSACCRPARGAGCRPKNSPVEPFGFAITPFVILGGGVVLWLFVLWQHRREDAGRDPLVHLALLKIAALRSGLEMFLSQNLVLMGVFFAVPLYLQLVQGLNALDTGIKMLPVSVTMFITSMAGSALASRFAPRRLIRLGLLVLVVAIGLLLSNIKPDLESVPFAIAMGLLGVGLGLMASQLGNVAQSSVGDNDRGEAGGLQYTSQQLGSALGVALIGAVVLTGLTSTFVQKIGDDPRVSDEIEQAVSVKVESGVSFVSSDTVRQAAVDNGVDPASTDALVEDYEDAQLVALKAGLLIAGFVAVVALFFTGGLPNRRPDEEGAPEMISSP